MSSEDSRVDTQERRPRDDRGRFQWHLRAKERQGVKPQAKREPGTRSSQSLWERAHGDLDFRPSASRTGGGWFLGFKPPGLWLFFTPALGTRASGPRCPQDTWARFWLKVSAKISFEECVLLLKIKPHLPWGPPVTGGSPRCLALYFCDLLHFGLRPRDVWLDLFCRQQQPHQESGLKAT